MAGKSKQANKGKQLEDAIIKQNEYYLKNEIATIKKIPNNWVVRRKGPHIVGANPVPSGLCDFVGTSHLVGGRSIVFDAKENKNKTNFPLRNIKVEQMDHMEETVLHGGIAFLIIHFTDESIDKTYFVPYKFIKPYWDDAEAHPDVKGMQSIPLKDIQGNCDRILGMEYMGFVQEL
jgi:recombination protein U